MDKDLARDKDPFVDDADGKQLWAEVSAEMQERGFTTFQFCPELEARLIPFRDSWYRAQTKAIARADGKLTERVRAEWAHQQAEKAEKQRKLDEEEWERQQAEEERMEMLKPKPIPETLRLEHTHVLGPSGSGKTTLLQNHILRDFLTADNNMNPDPPAYIVLDPKGLMIERLSRLKMFERILSNRIVIVDPFDKPALNLFQTTGRDPEQLISDFSYIFSTTKQKLTGKQASCFAFCARLLFTVTGANLLTLLDLLDDRTNKKPPNPIFQRAIPLLPEVPRRFFEADFYAPNYASTREEIKARVYGVLGSDSLAAMFNANLRTLDMAHCIRERKIVLVNTRMTHLKEAHQTFGRYIISLTQDAIQARKERHPVYLVIDEFQEFADPEKTPQMLRLIREYGGGAVLAHQNMYCAELDDATRNAISTNTSIKYASSPEGQDLGYMVRDLRCDAEFLKQQHKSQTHARFACYVRGMSPPLQHPFIVQSAFGWIDAWPKMSDETYKTLREFNQWALSDEKPKTPEGPEGPPAGGAQVHNQNAAPPGAMPMKPIVPQKDSDPSKPAKWVRG